MPSKQALPNALENLSSCGMAIRKIEQTVEYDDFTDGGSTAGTMNLSKQIPAGSFVIGSKVTVLTGFTGDTSCTLAIGDSGDSNCYSGNTTHNIYAAATNLVQPAYLTADCGLNAEASANSILLTATGASDFTAITAGKIIVEVFYFSTNPE